VARIRANIKTFPVDSDPRVAGLLAAQSTAAGVLIAAQQSLTSTRATVGTAGSVADYIARADIGDVLQVHSAAFQGSLNAVSGGTVTMTASLTFMGHPQPMSWTFDFHDPITGARNLADALLGG
jgi:hypothetical protein